MRDIFPELIGNETLKKTLSSDLASRKSAHAYILEGPEGSGKHTAALYICAAVLCENRNDVTKPLPCGSCITCRKVLSGKSVDIMTVSNDDKASIGVDDIRAVRSSLYVTPNDGDYKFYIIENAHLMTPQAQNALLLSLEDPPDFVKFLLLANDSSFLLETVRSRAPVIKTELFQSEFIEKYLTDFYKNECIDHEKIVFASHLSHGSIGQAKKLYKSGDAEMQLYKTAEEFVKVILSGSRSEAVVFVSSKFPKERIKVREILSLSRFALRDMISSKKGGDLLFYGTKEGVPAFAKKVSQRRILDLTDDISKAEISITSNASQLPILLSLICKY